MSRAFTVIECDQRSPEWFTARLGRLTGSVAADAIARNKNGEEAYTRRDLRIQLALERITGQQAEEGFVSFEMRRGIELEPTAMAAYELASGQMAVPVGFVSHDTLPIGCSPDGVLDEFQGLLSLKCPKSATHLKYLRAGAMPAEYVPQMLHELWVTGAQYYDFVSFDPRFPAALQIFLVRTDRDEAAVKGYADKALAFLSELDVETRAIATLGNLGAVLQEAARA